MRLILLTLLLTSSYFGKSQITVSSADFAVTGDTVRMSSANDPTIDFLTTGPNQSWNYSYLLPTNQVLNKYSDISGLGALITLAYGMFAPPKYQASYHLPSTNLPLDQVSGFLPIEISDPKTFSRLTSDSLAAVGYALSIEGNEIPFKADTIEAYYKFPLDYLSSYEGMGHIDIDMNPYYEGRWIQKRWRSSEVDGWGTITTPYGTFDALRVRHTITEIDSLQISFLGSPMWVELPIPMNYSYEWWTNNEKDAILRINTRRVGGNEVVTDVSYRDNYISLAAINEKENVEISVYPNPVTTELNVSGLNDYFTYSIIDPAGKVVMSGQAIDKISVDTLDSGNFILVLRTKDRIHQHQFIKP